MASSPSQLTKFSKLWIHTDRPKGDFYLGDISKGRIIGSRTFGDNIEFVVRCPAKVDKITLHPIWVQTGYTGPRLKSKYDSYVLSQDGDSTLMYETYFFLSYREIQAVLSTREYFMVMRTRVIRQDSAGTYLESDQCLTMDIPEYCSEEITEFNPAEAIVFDDGPQADICMCTACADDREMREVDNDRDHCGGSN